MACLVIKLVNDSVHANIIIYNDYISHFVMALLSLTIIKHITMAALLLHKSSIKVYWTIPLQ